MNSDLTDLSRTRTKCVKVPPRTQFKAMTGFEELGVDRRIVEAVWKMGITNPTPVQTQGVPLAVEGRDLLLAAPTGSGKTLAFGLPTLSLILAKPSTGNVRAVILAPTHELSWQITRSLEQLCRFCWESVGIAGLGEDFDKDKVRLMEGPDIIVGTPTRILKLAKSTGVSLESVEMVVMDEADLVLDYGHQADLDGLLVRLPKLHQTIMTSATLSPEIDALKQLVLQKPAVVSIAEDEDATEGEQRIEHFHVDLSGKGEDDEFLFLFSLIKLKVIQGKTIFFVNDIDRCFRLKLFLDAFSIPSAALNSQLPSNSRKRTIHHFNKGIFDFLIATDESIEESEEVSEAGVSRGIDFKDVLNVVNFDFPGSLKSYIHRVGRSARGGELGTALSFVRNDPETLIEVQEYLEEQNTKMEVLEVQMKDINGFRYRVEDILRGCTRNLIKEAQIKQVKWEMLNSDKLKAYFEDNPKEADLLKNDKVIRPRKAQPHLRVIPDYLVKENMGLPKLSRVGNTMRHSKRNLFRKRKYRNNPLKSFKTGNRIPRAGEANTGIRKRRKK